MRLLLLSVALSSASLFTYLGADYSYRFEDVESALVSITAACWFILLLSVAIPIIGSTDEKGRLLPPDSLAKLLCWALLIPQGGLAISLLVNFRPFLEMNLAASYSTGARIRYLGDGVALLEGEIGFDTYDSLSNEFDRNSISMLKLKSGGGLLDTAVELGALVRSKGTSTYVDEFCGSACVIVALSGPQLFVSPTAQFGFHQGSALASVDSEWGRFLAKVATEQLVEQLRLLGVPKAILEKAERTPPEEIYYVSGDELIRAGLAKPIFE